jgi:predicted neuraminidase
MPLTDRRGRMRAVLVAVVAAAAVLAAMRIARLPAAPGAFAVPALAAASGGESVPSLAGAAAPAEFPTARAAAPADPAVVPPARSVSARAGAAVHAASAVLLRDGRLRAAWFSGSREGAADVEIRTAVYDPALGRWSAESTALTRAALARGLARSIKKLGNPVIVRAADGRLHLYVVSVTLGGWAGSAINRLVSDDEGVTWQDPRRLVTSPFGNLGTLVKGRPLPLADGQVGLPVYHELATRFPEWLRLDADGRVLDRIRFPHGEFSLQPVVLAVDDRHAVAFMRQGVPQPPQRVTTASTADAGRSWSPVVQTTLPNPNAAVAVLATRAGDWWMVFNDSELDRGNLSLAWARAPAPGEVADWHRVAVLDGVPPPQRAPIRAAEHGPLLAAAAAAMPDPAGATREADARAVAEAAGRQLCHPAGGDTWCNREYSYPSLIEGADGSVHVLYTWHRARIAHRVLPPDWLAARRSADGAPR